MKKLKRIILIILIILCVAGITYAASTYVFTANQVKYKKTSTTNIKVQAALDELETMAIKPQVGDIVNYDANKDPSTKTAFATPYSYTTHNTNSTTDNEYTGSSTSTTFNSNDTATWKIMDINHDTGAIKLMEAGSFTKTLELKGRAGYAYCENILDNACAVYGHGYGAESARSIRVEDINARTGFNPVKEGYGIHSQSYTKGNYFVELEYENGKVKANSHVAKSYSAVKQPYTADKSYYYTGTTYLANTTNSYKMIFKKSGTTSNRSYWLASRCVDFYSDNCYYEVRSVGSDHVSYNDLCYSIDSDEDYGGVAVCPVVSLSSSVQLSYVSTSDGIATWNIK